MNRIFALLTFLAFVTVAQHARAQDAGPPTFEDHPGICLIHAAPPQLVPGTPEWDFRTRIREGTDGACPDFDGAFKKITWGCGTECQQGVIVDLTDGKVYWLPGVASYGYETHAESLMLILNSFSKSEFPDGVPDYLWREFYEFNNGKWTMIYRDKGAE